MERTDKAARIDDEDCQLPANSRIAEAALEKWEMLDRHSSPKRKRFSSTRTHDLRRDP